MKRFWKDFAQGDSWVKGSCLVMGLGCIKRGQIVKGLMYLAAEVLFFLFFLLTWTFLYVTVPLALLMENALLRLMT